MRDLPRAFAPEKESWQFLLELTEALDGWDCRVFMFSGVLCASHTEDA